MSSEYTCGDPIAPVDDVDQLKTLQDAYHAQKRAEAPCPHCGYCPHCGRGGAMAPYPHWPNYSWSPFIYCTTPVY
jgi:hypothetical protein